MNTVAGIAGSFIGLVLGGVLGPVSWRLVFLVSVPVGLFGTLWSWRKLVDLGVRQPARIDWWGNLTFAAGLIAILVGITYGIQPYGGHTMGWTSPEVLACMGGGLAAACDLRRDRDRASRTRCSGSASSASAPSPPATSPRCWPRSAAAG